MIQWGEVSRPGLTRGEAAMLRRRMLCRQEAERVRVRDNRIVLGVFLVTMSYLAVHVAVWAARSLR